MTVDGKTLLMTSEVRDDPARRAAFNRLTRQVFGFDFQAWYDGGYWGDRYIPYLLLEGDRAVANVSVNVMDFQTAQGPRWLGQLGTVMTDPGCRGRGFCRLLLEQVLEEWTGQCDGIYLYANQTVLGLYPKFGFHRQEELQHVGTPPPPNGLGVRRLEMGREADRRLLLRAYKQSNPFSACAMTDNQGLLMFYCTGMMKNDVYHIPELDAVAVALYSGHTMVLADVFCGGGMPMEAVVGALAEPGTTRVVYGFSPLDPRGCSPKPMRQEDTVLFALGDWDGVFQDPSVMMPLLSHA